MEIFQKDFEVFWKLSKNKITEIDLDYIFANTQENSSILWGFAPISPIHTGYDKIFYLLSSLLEKTNSKLNLLAADIPTKLSHGKDLLLLKKIADYYKFYIANIWNIPVSFHLTSDYFYSKKYQDLLFRSLSLMTEGVVKDTWNTQQKEAKLVYQYIYPLIQILDVIYFRPKIVFSEYSQYKIYKILPKLLKKLEIDLEDTYFVFIKQSLDIKGKPLTRSTQKDRITIHESADSLRSKLKYCASFQTTENNPFLDLLEYSILPFKEAYDIPLNFETRDELRQEIMEGDLLLPDSLDMVCNWFNIKMSKVQAKYNKSKNKSLLDWINFEKIQQNV